MNILEVKKGLIDVLKAIFPNKKFYSKAVVENYDRPCFFTTLKVIESNASNYNSMHVVANFYISYLPKKASEAELLEVARKVQEAFQLSVKVGDRHLMATDLDFDYQGTEKDILEISMTLEWFDKINHTATEPLIGSIETKIEVKERESYGNA